VAQPSQGKFSYDYPRPAVTADIAIVTIEAAPRVLLIKRKNQPFAGKWALPGGYVDEMERLADAARRELREETGVENVELEQLHAFGDPGRDPRGWTITIAFLARVRPESVKPIAGDDAAEARWFPLAELPDLAFDHAEILQSARNRVDDRTP
jgi:8-oxo-dGTP diphosphatase